MGEDSEKVGLTWTGWAVIVAASIGLGSCGLVMLQSHVANAEKTYARRDNTNIQFEYIKQSLKRIEQEVKR